MLTFRELEDACILLQWAAESAPPLKRRGLKPLFKIIEDLLGDCEELEEYQYKEIEAYLIIIEKMIRGRL